MEARSVSRRRFLGAAAALAGAAGPLGCANRDAGEPKIVLIRDVAVAFDPAGNHYELEFARHEVRRLAPDGSVAWRVGGAPDTGPFNYPSSLAVGADGTVYVADRGNGEVDVLSASGIHRFTFGDALASAQDIALDPATAILYVTDGPRHRVQAFSAQGETLHVAGGFDVEGAGLNYPRGIALSPDRELHVVDAGNGRIQVYGLDGGYRRSYGDRTAESGQLHAPRDIVFDSRGRPIVSDPVSSRLAWFDEHGRFLRFLELPSAAEVPPHPLFLAIDPENRLHVTVI